MGFNFEKDTPVFSTRNPIVRHNTVLTFVGLVENKNRNSSISLVSTRYCDIRVFINNLDKQKNLKTDHLIIITPYQLTLVNVESDVEYVDLIRYSDPKNIGVLIDELLVYDKDKQYDKFKFKRLNEMAGREISLNEFMSFQDYITDEFLTLLELIDGENNLGSGKVSIKSLHTEFERLYDLSNEILKSILIVFLFSNSTNTNNFSFLSLDVRVELFKHMMLWTDRDYDFIDFFVTLPILSVKNSIKLPVLSYLPVEFGRSLILNLMFDKEKANTYSLSEIIDLHYRYELLGTKTIFQKEVLFNQFNIHYFNINKMNSLVSSKLVPDTWKSNTHIYFLSYATLQVMYFIESNADTLDFIKNYSAQIRLPLSNFYFSYFNSIITKYTRAIEIYHSFDLSPDKVTEFLHTKFQNLTEQLLELEDYEAIYRIINLMILPIKELEQLIENNSVDFSMNVDQFINSIEENISEHVPDELLSIVTFERLSWLMFQFLIRYEPNAFMFNSEVSFLKKIIRLRLDLRKLEDSDKCRSLLQIMTTYEFDLTIKIAKTLFETENSPLEQLKELLSHTLLVLDIKNKNSGLRFNLIEIITKFISYHFHEFTREDLKPIISALHERENYHKWDRANIMLYLFHCYVSRSTPSDEFKFLWKHLFNDPIDDLVQENSDDPTSLYQDLLSIIESETTNSTEISSDYLKSLMSQSLDLDPEIKQPIEPNILPDGLFDKFKDYREYLDYLIFHLTYYHVKDQMSGKTLSKDDLRKYYYMLLNVHFNGLNLIERFGHQFEFRGESQFVVDPFKMEILKIHILKEINPIDALNDLVKLHQKHGSESGGITVQEIREIHDLFLQLLPSNDEKREIIEIEVLKIDNYANFNLDEIISLKTYRELLIHFRYDICQAISKYLDIQVLWNYVVYKFCQKNLGQEIVHVLDRLIGDDWQKYSRSLIDPKISDNEYYATLDYLSIYYPYIKGPFFVILESSDLEAIMESFPKYADKHPFYQLQSWINLYFMIHHHQNEEYPKFEDTILSIVSIISTIVVYYPEKKNLNKIDLLYYFTESIKEFGFNEQYNRILKAVDTNLFPSEEEELSKELNQHKLSIEEYNLLREFTKTHLRGLIL